MNRLRGLSGLKSLDQYNSLGSVSGTVKTFSISSRPSSDSVSSGSFANLKLTAEKLIKEQASAKSDLELANSKVKTLTGHVSVLEEKLQNSFNENAKLKVKHKEDEKLWKGLESKFSSTKTLCDQLTETLQHLARHVEDAEKNKSFFEDKLSTTSTVLDGLHEQMKCLSLRVETCEETIRNREEELKDLCIEKEELEKCLRDEQNRAASVIKENDAAIKNFEATVAANELAVERLGSQVEELRIQLRLKEDDVKLLRISRENLEKETNGLLSCNNELSRKLDMALQEIKDLEDFVTLLTLKMTEFDYQSLALSDKFVQLNGLFDSCLKKTLEKQDLSLQHAQHKYNQLHDHSLLVTSEKNALQLVSQDLSNKFTELQKEQEFSMVQHAEECRLTEERIRRLESEIENLHSKKTEMESMISKLQGINDTLSENLRLSEEKMEDQLQKFSSSEAINKDNVEKLHEEIHKKQIEVDAVQNAIRKHEDHVESLEKHINQLSNTLEERELLVLQNNEREKHLENEKAQIQALLANAESKLTEAKKQYDQMLDSKQSELSRHLKEISQKNDQAINDIRKKFEVEKQESVNLEREKAEKVIGEMEKECDKKLVKSKEESEQFLMRIREEHAALINSIQQDHEKKELSLTSKHGDELKRVQLQAENELRERTISLRNEHEVQLKALRSQNEDECRKLQEELDIQKSKEERQRALLQLQWKVMGDKPQEEEEVNSRKNYSSLSTKRRNPNSNRSQRGMTRDKEETGSPQQKLTQTPVLNLLKKVEKANKGSVMSIPKHSRKVTHHEYEVETSNGRTITKRRKTRSTVMFGDPRKHKRLETPDPNTPRNVVKGMKGGSHTNPSNIGDLFSEGSLNPYADDPYAFD